MSSEIVNLISCLVKDMAQVSVSVCVPQRPLVTLIGAVTGALLHKRPAFVATQMPAASADMLLPSAAPVLHQKATGNCQSAGQGLPLHTLIARCRNLHACILVSPF